MKKRVGILISGRGSNMVALIEAARAPDYPAEIVLVISNRPDAAGLERARAAGIEAVAIDHKGFATREAFDGAVEEALLGHGVDLVCHAGFMRIQSDGVRGTLDSGASSTSIHRCCRPSGVSSRSSRRWTQGCASPVARSTSSRPSSTPARSLPRRRCRCWPATRPTRLPSES